jgi:nicotinamidase-related amidase
LHQEGTVTAPGLLRADTSMLLVVDVQVRLVPAIHDAATVVERIVWLVRLAQALGVPVAATEQYPQGLGPTVPALAALLPHGSIGEKVHFSSAAAGCLPKLPGAQRPQVVLAGTQAHVCVLETAFGLAAEGREVFVVADAVGSRDPGSRTLALERMARRGIGVVSREMVGFEWLERAGTERFREISREFLR